MTDLIRRNMMMAASADEKIIDAVKGGVSGDAANDAALMEVIYAQGWSKSPLYMTQREAEAVTSVGTAFQGNTAIKDFAAFKYFTSVTTIEKSAFENCTGLLDFVLPASVVSIKELAYAGCTSLDIISIPAKINVNRTFLNNCGTVTSLIFTAKDIEEYIKPFSSDYNINNIISANIIGTSFVSRYIELEEGDIYNIVIPDTIKTLQNNTFNGVKNISHVDLNAVTTIGGNVFANSSLSSITIGDTLKRIYNSAFVNVTINNNITIPNECTIEGYAFSGITVNGDIYIPSSVKYVQTSFSSAGGQKPVTINGKASILITDLMYRQLLNIKVKTLELNQQEITNIGTQALSIDNSYYSGNLTELYFPNIETIGDFVFSYVTKFTKIRFGDKVASIGIDINVGSAQTIELETTTPPTLKSIPVGTWYVPRSAQAAYEAAPYWSDLNTAGKLKYLEEL